MWVSHFIILQALYCMNTRVYYVLLIPYSRGKTFVDFMVFMLSANIFPSFYITSLNLYLKAKIHESFPVNSEFCLQLRKFFPSKVLPLTVHSSGHCHYYCSLTNQQEDLFNVSRAKLVVFVETFLVRE